MSELYDSDSSLNYSTAVTTQTTFEETYLLLWRCPNMCTVQSTEDLANMSG